MVRADVEHRHGVASDRDSDARPLAGPQPDAAISRAPLRERHAPLAQASRERENDPVVPAARVVAWPDLEADDRGCPAVEPEARSQGANMWRRRDPVGRKPVPGARDDGAALDLD